MRSRQLYRLLGLALLAWIGVESSVYCPVVNGIPWKLFREKCYYRYYAPSGINGTPAEDAEEHYKTWFEAREECAKLGATLASVHDQATQEKVQELVAVNETMKSFEQATWIGLQVGTLKLVGRYNATAGDAIWENKTGCYWPADVRPRLENDPCPENAVEQCSITYNETYDTFQGQWEDGQLYDKEESADFWSEDQPNQLESDKCDEVKFGRMSYSNKVDEQSKAYCERGVNGKPDRLQHCVLVLPPKEENYFFFGEDARLTPGKWIDYFCWVKVRGYICERPAKKRSEDSTSAEVETQTTAMPTPCEARRAACMNRARGRIDEIEREINAMRTGFSGVLETMALSNASAGKPWLGGSASFGGLAQSAVDFGRVIARLSAEECIPYLRRLQLPFQDLSEKMEENYKKITTHVPFLKVVDNKKDIARVRALTAYQMAHFEYNQNIQQGLRITYDYGLKTLTKDSTWAHFRERLMERCDIEEKRPENVIMNMGAYFESPTPKDGTNNGSYLNMLALLVAYAPEIKENVQLLMAEVDTDVRLALTLLGVCVQSKNLSESELYESSKKVIQALSKVNDAFQRALQDDTPSSTLAPPQNDTSSGTVTSPVTLAPSTPYGEDVVAFMNQTARNILGKEVKDKLDSQGWTGREELHEKIVNDTVDALSKNMSRYVFNALAYLPYNRDDQQCRRFPEGKFVDVGYTNLNFFVLYASNDTKQTADEAWERLKDNVKAREAVLNRVFAKSSDGLCGRLDTALKDINTTAFHGFAAVKCGYEFVWYELGYAYFYAAHSSTGYKWEKKGSAYDVKCGQIFFFP